MIIICYIIEELCLIASIQITPYKINKSNLMLLTFKTLISLIYAITSFLYY